MEYDILLYNTQDFYLHFYHASLVTLLDIDHVIEYLGEDPIKSYATCILDVKCKQTDIH